MMSNPTSVPKGRRMAGHCHEQDHARDTGQETMRVKDPVCGMQVDPEASAHHAAHRGSDYHFCSAGCRTRFVADPARYLGAPQAAAEAPPGTIYTCPMHPE